MSSLNVKTLEAVFIVKQLKSLDNSIDWNGLVDVVFPHYVLSDIEPIPVTIESMLRIYFLQMHYSLSAEEVVRAVFIDDAYRNFSLINLEYESMPTPTCIDAFNSLILGNNLKTEVYQAFHMEAA